MLVGLSYLRQCIKSFAMKFSGHCRRMKIQSKGNRQVGRLGERIMYFPMIADLSDAGVIKKKWQRMAQENFRRKAHVKGRCLCFIPIAFIQIHFTFTKLLNKIK